jgi:hypothetical protein
MSEVFYHTNGNGDSVYFDSLGQPWEIHACFSEYWQQEKERRNLLGSLSEYQHFLSSSVSEREQRKRLLFGAIQNVYASLSEEAVAEQMGLSKRELRKYYGSFYKPSGFSESVWKREVERAVTGKGDDLTTEASLDFLEAIFGCEKVVKVYYEVEQKEKESKSPFLLELILKHVYVLQEREKLVKAIELREIYIFILRLQWYKEI